MKRITLTLLLGALLLAACNSGENKALVKKGSSGKTLEVLVVGDRGVYDGDVKELTDSLLRESILTLPQPEPRFSVVNIPQSSLENTQMFRMHRNIVVLDVKPDNPDKAYIHRDQWAEPQVVVELAARDTESLLAMIRRHSAAIKEAIYDAEHRRVQRAYWGMRGTELMKQLREKFAFDLTLSEDFSWAREDDDFVWIRKETKDFSLGLLVHTYPYESEHQFDSIAILDRIDTMMRHYVPGPLEGSYMGTERRLAPDMARVKLGDSPYCVETRGLWRTFGDFMGGPFVTYTALSPDKRRVVELTGFVYCPRTDRYSKRDLLMQMEGVCHSIKF